MGKRDAPPPVHFDGRIYWYTEWTPLTGRHCCLCRGPIDDDEVPLILWKGTGKATWEAHFCDVCMPILMRFMSPPARETG